MRFILESKKKGSILNIGVEEKKVEHKSPKSCRIESSNLIFTGGVYALQGLYNKNGSILNIGVEEKR